MSASIGRRRPRPPLIAGFYTIGTAFARVTGTAIGSTEAEIVTGGLTIILTITGDSWVATAGFDAIRQDIIDGISGDDADQLHDGIVVGNVVRTSDAVVTITLPAIATFDIASLATYTVTVPSTALKLAAALVATPSFNIGSSSASSAAVARRRLSTHFNQGVM